MWPLNRDEQAATSYPQPHGPPLDVEIAPWEAAARRGLAQPVKATDQPLAETLGGHVSGGQKASASPSP